MLSSITSRRSVPLCIYGVTAIWCWLTPSSLVLDDSTIALNAFPTNALALVTVGLAIAHAGLALRGTVVVTAAGCWAVATVSMVTVFAVFPHVAPSTWSAIMVAQTLTVVTSACAFSILAWQLLWGRLAAGAHPVARGSVAAGVAMLTFNYAMLALGEAGVLARPTGLEEIADSTAGLIVDLWISSAFLVLGPVIHGVLSRLGSDCRGA